MHDSPNDRIDGTGDASTATPVARQRVPRPPNGSGKHGRPTYGQAARITELFRGPAAFARAVGVERVTVYRWNYAKPLGTDGLIPAAMVERVQQAARIEGIFLTPKDWEPARISYDDKATLDEVMS